jgi:hypothetical protein
MTLDAVGMMNASTTYQRSGHASTCNGWRTIAMMINSSATRYLAAALGRIRRDELLPARYALTH